MTLRDILPPKARKITYAVLAVAAPVTTTVVVALNDGFQAADIPLIVGSFVTSAGFGVAAANTPSGQ